MAGSVAAGSRSMEHDLYLGAIWIHPKNVACSKGASVLLSGEISPARVGRLLGDLIPYSLRNFLA